MKLNRLISIVMTLLEYERISAGELAKMFEVTKRTIYRDIDTLSMAGIPIVTYSGINGGISIMDSYKFDKKLFTQNDIINILSGLENIFSAVKNKDIHNTVSKLKTYIPQNEYKNLELKSNQMIIDFSTWRKERSLLKYSEKIKEALNKNLKIKFFYSDRTGENTERKVEPHQLILKESNWYLHAYCDLRKEFRVFKLSRISNLEIIEEKFKIREFDSKPLEKLEWIKSRLIDIKVIINNSVKDRMIEMFGIKKEIKLDDNKTTLFFSFIPDNYGYGMLLSLGDKCECIEPEFVRTELKNRVEKMWKLYNK